MINNSLGLSERSSVATIVGTFFFLVVMIGGFAALITAFELNSDLLEGQFKISQQETQKVQEDFTIAAAYDSILGGKSNALCVTIDNIGAVPLEIRDLFIVNKTDSNFPVFPIEVSYKDSFVPMGSSKNILESRLDTTNQITLEDANHTLDIKVVTTSGIAKTTELAVFSSSGGSDPRLKSNLVVIPPGVASAQNVTLILSVFNLANTTLLNVQPDDTPVAVPTVVPLTSIPDGFHLVGATPSPVPRLEPHESAIFVWAAEIIGGIGTLIDFTANVKAQVEGCTSPASFIESEGSTARIKVVPGVRREILQKPELFVTLPNPFGDIAGADKGIFAIAVSNPTDQTFTIDQVAVQLIIPTGGDILASSTGLTPSTGTWQDVPNAAFWKAAAGSPIELGAFNTTSFSVGLEPKVTGATESPINAVMFSIYSSFGQFNRGPFTFGTDDKTTAIVNVYMNSSFLNQPNSLGTSGIARYTVPEILAAKTDQQWNFTITNTGDDHIDEDSYLIINLPSGFLGVDSFLTNNALDQSSAKVTIFADGSRQVTVRVNGEIKTDDTATLQFQSDIPSVSTIALFTFTAVANGTALTDGANIALLGPLAETLIQVCPDSGGNPDCTTP